MSQFDFPRINFNGKAYIDPGTANNNYYFPLVIYDPVLCEAYLPPRLYLNPRFLSKEFSQEQMFESIPPSVEIRNSHAKEKYIELTEINEKSIFLDWAKTPLGSHQLDRNYHSLYEMFVSPKSKEKLTGKRPAYWNLFGKMTFGFEDVRVSSIEFLDDNKNKVVLNEQNKNYPISQLIHSEFNIVDQFGTHTGQMIDVCPSMSVYSQTFCDFMFLKSEKKTWFKGKPYKGSVRFMNPSRIVNQDSICGASGSFFSAISLENMQPEDNDDFIKLLKPNLKADKEIRGLFIRYNMFELIENRNPDYKELGDNSNPAYCTIIGSITPWYEEDMKSFTIGRQLNDVKPFLGFRTLGSLMCKIDHQLGLLSIDLTGNIPEINLDVVDPAIDPVHRDQRYMTYDLGELSILLESKGRPDIPLAKIRIDDSTFNRSQLLESGAIFDFLLPVDLSTDDLISGNLIIMGTSRKSQDDIGQSCVLSRESQYLITTDEAGLYANEGDDPTDGYVSYGYPKEACRLRLFSKGKPVKEPVKLNVLEYSVKTSGHNFKIAKLSKNNLYCDGQHLEIPIDSPSNSVFLFSAEMKIPRMDNIYKELMHTGYFISLRVLPNKKFEKYFNPNDPSYREEIDFDLLYEEVFKLYDLIYPVSGEISPFNIFAFQKGKNYIKRLMNDSNWASTTYMPSSRELSDHQKKLFLQWFHQQ